MSIFAIYTSSKGGKNADPKFTLDVAASSGIVERGDAKLPVLVVAMADGSTANVPLKRNVYVPSGSTIQTLRVTVNVEAVAHKAMAAPVTVAGSAHLFGMDAATGPDVGFIALLPDVSGIAAYLGRFGYDAKAAKAMAKGIVGSRNPMAGWWGALICPPSSRVPSLPSRSCARGEKTLEKVLVTGYKIP